MDLISVVIPSRNRSNIVGRAVYSALNQTWAAIEVIVVIDGPDERTVEALRRIGDSRLRFIQLEQSQGAQNARNVGVRAAHGKWIAFLDDDDEWFSTKIERQLEAAQSSQWAHPIASCGLIAQGPEGRDEWPKRAPRETETIAEYLFLRRNSEIREIRLQTSTLMAPKELLLRVPWRKCPNDEWDLLIRASAVEGAGLAFVAGPLTIWHSDCGVQRLSHQGKTWRHDAAWFHSLRDLVGPCCYASFFLSTLSSWARTERDWPAFFRIPWLCIRYGRPTMEGMLEHFGRWLLPHGLRRRLKRGALHVDRQRRSDPR